MNTGMNITMWGPIIHVIISCIFILWGMRVVAQKKYKRGLIYIAWGIITTIIFFVSYGPGKASVEERRDAMAIVNEKSYGLEKSKEILKEEQEDNKSKELKAMDRDASKETKEADDYLKKAVEDAKNGSRRE